MVKRARGIDIRVAESTNKRSNRIVNEIGTIQDIVFRGQESQWIENVREAVQVLVDLDRNMIIRDDPRTIAMWIVLSRYSAKNDGEYRDQDGYYIDNVHINQPSPYLDIEEFYERDEQIAEELDSYLYYKNVENIPLSRERFYNTFRSYDIKINRIIQEKRDGDGL